LFWAQTVSLVLHLAPALHHVERLVEGARVLDGHHGFEGPAVGTHLEALDDMLVLGVRRAVPIEKAVVGEPIAKLGWRGELLGFEG
jgi:hypothetical protein